MIANVERPQYYYKFNAISVYIKHHLCVCSVNIHFLAMKNSLMCDGGGLASKTTFKVTPVKTTFNKLYRFVGPGTYLHKCNSSLISE